MTWTFAGRDRGGMADQGDQLALATGLDPQDAKAILGVLVSDPLDQSGEHLVIGLRGLALHDGPSHPSSPVKSGAKSGGTPANRRCGSELCLEMSHLSEGPSGVPPQCTDVSRADPG